MNKPLISDFEFIYDVLDVIYCYQCPVSKVVIKSKRSSSKMYEVIRFCQRNNLISMFTRYSSSKSKRDIEYCKLTDKGFIYFNELKKANNSILKLRRML